VGLEINLEVEQRGVEILVLPAEVSKALMDHALDPEQSRIGGVRAQQAFDHLPRLVVEREGLRQPALLLERVCNSLIAQRQIAPMAGVGRIARKCLLR
jgi:hypothetical protein